MPLLTSSYSAPIPFLNRHFQTVFPRYFRKVKGSFFRERILTPDRDFLDLDWSTTGAARIAILSHGLEGSSHSAYMLGMTKILNQAGWDVLAWNLRSCSGEPNWQPCWYHGGRSDDLRSVFSHVLFTKRYSEIVLVGFSLGGNITLKFLGEHSLDLSALVSKAVVFSVPCSLASAAERLSKGKNLFYARHFINKLKRKVKAKLHLLPERFQKIDIDGLKNFIQFDNALTGPVHGFRDANDYWDRCSANRFLGGIRVPTLIVNALDDPFLGKGCYPFEQARKSPYISLECPARGGHIGFISLNHKGAYWSDRRALAFLQEQAEEATCEALYGT